MRARTLAAALGVFFSAALGVAHAAPVTLYAQPDASGEMVSEQPTFVTASIASASLGNLNLGKGPLYLTFTMQDPHAGDGFGYPGGVALGSCPGCRDLQAYFFTDADRMLLSDGASHTFTVKTGTTTSEYVNGLNPVYITFFSLSQYQYSTHVKSNAAATIPYLLIEADTLPPPPVLPPIPQGSVTLYDQPDATGTMTDPQPTSQNAYIDSGSSGNLPLGQGPLYLTFTMKDPNAGAARGLPEGVCLEPTGTTDCSTRLQTYFFTDADRALLASGGFHTFRVATGTTTSAYADGSRPVAIGFFGLSQFQFGTKLWSNAAGTLPMLTIDQPPAPPTGVSNVLFIPGTEASRLYMRESDGSERQLWEPAIWTDIPELALNADGTSKNRIYTKDIIGNLYDNAGARGTAIRAALKDGAKVYGDFETFMDSLVASSTVGMKEWRAYPYDWRFDPRDVVEKGTLTEMSDNSLKQVYLEAVLDELASSSATGKVTIVTHSNGGFLAKALINKLEAEGKAGEVDRLVFIGTPQWGTPTDVGVMLHGDGQGHALGLIAYAPQARAAAATMPDPYDLLPSSTYFAHVADPAATFVNGGLTAPFHQAFPNGIRSWSDMSDFASDAHNLDSSITDPNTLDVPYKLWPSLLANATTLHSAFDAWTPPAGLKVTSIAGWGQPTTYGYEYTQHVGHVFCLDLLSGFSCATQPTFVHLPLETEDGDDTVVSPSAVGGGGDVWYFNAERFQTDKKGRIVHQDLTSASPIQQTILDIFEKKPVAENYIGNIKPSGTGIPLTIIGVESPVNILVTDASGNQTGISPLPQSDGLYFTKHDIPDSAVNTSGENKFVILPAGAIYSVTATGYASGPTTLLVENLDANGVMTSSSTIADIPVATSTTISLSVDTTGIPSPVSVDLDGNGTVDTTIAPGTGASAAMKPSDYLAYVEKTVATIPLDPKVTKQIEVRLENVGHMLAADGEWDPADTDTLSKRVGKKVDQVVSYVNSAGIPPDLASHILAMLGAMRSLTLNL